jgi:protein gp37
MIKSTIQWTDMTVNFWTGCQKVSPGCKYCYMHRLKDKWGDDGSEITRTSDKTFYQALFLKEPRRIFTCSMSDFFIEEADHWRDDAWSVIRRTPQHVWMILTKRPERVIQCLPPDWGEGWSNVWLGVSVESQTYMHRVKTLTEIPSEIRFISAEPLLEEIDFLQKMDWKRPIDHIDWVILGGESGNETGKHLYRPCELSWLERALNDLTTHTKAKVFVKQLGTHLRKTLHLRDKHGGDPNEWAPHLRVTEYPG